MKTLPVQIPGAEYVIDIGWGVLPQKFAEAITRFASDLVVVVTNPTLQALYPDYLASLLKVTGLRSELCLIPDGEQYKNWQTIQGIYDFLLEKRANRKTLLVAFGGGVIGDMVGFAAATFMRGIPFVQVPSTLLAQVDSSVGGKTGVNHPLAKNSIGAFKQPVYVAMDLELLRTLPARELKAGFLELIKHGIIHDAELFHFLQSQPDLLKLQKIAELEEAIYRSCRVKGRIVEADEKETGLRATLNFGHTLAHIIETHTDYIRYLHGEAVGVGMLFACFASKELGLLSEETYERMIDLLRPLVTPVELPPLDFPLFQNLLLHDKKSEKQTVNFIVCLGIGRCDIHQGTRPDWLWDVFLKFLQAMPWACKIASI